MKFTCDGEDYSPLLQWTGAPDGTKSLALICDDPDAPRGTWVHGLVYGLPATPTGLPEALPTIDTLFDGARQGVNDFKRTGYGEPCPPPGKLHFYFFRLYALDIVMNLEPHPTKAELLKVIKGHIIGEGALSGTYRRRR